MVKIRPILSEMDEMGLFVCELVVYFGVCTTINKKLEAYI